MHVLVSKGVMILVAITNRASYPRCKTLISALGADVFLMNPELDISLEYPNAYVSNSRVRGNMAATTASVMSDFSYLLLNVKPDAVVVVADRHEVLGVAAATRMNNIPLIHLLAGERSGSVDDDIRFSISALSQLLLAPHTEAQEELKRRGYESVVTGCPSIDLCEPGPKPDINSYGSGDYIDLGSPYCIVVQHPDTNKSERENVDLLESIYSLIDEPAVWVRPNEDLHGRAMDKMLNQLSEKKTYKEWRVVKHIPYSDMITLVANCTRMIGNSSMMHREAAYLGVSCFQVGDRQRGRASAGWFKGGGKIAAETILDFLAG